jgi:hypothetical protein
MKTTQENTMKTTQDNNHNDVIQTSIAAASATAAAVVATNIDWIKKDISEIKESLKSMSCDYVTQVEFRPIRSLIYGLVGLILVAVVGALLALVILKV